MTSSDVQSNRSKRSVGDNNPVSYLVDILPGLYSSTEELTDTHKVQGTRLEATVPDIETYLKR